MSEPSSSAAHKSRRILTGYREGGPIQVGDVALDLSNGTILSRRDGYWVDGGFQPHVQNYYSGDPDGDVTVPLLRVEDERVDGPLQLLYRPPTTGGF